MRCPMHAEINVRLDLRIATDKTIPLAALAEFICEQDIEATIVEETIHSLDEHLTREYCGEKHARGNGSNRYRRAARKPRTAVTTAGEHEFSLQYVKDTDAGSGEQSHFRPIEDVIDFDGKRIYQPDISFRGVDRAVNLSYRDAADDRETGFSLPSRSTIHRHLKETGAKLREYLPDQLEGTKSETIQADGTKCHSQESNTAFHDIHVTLGNQDDTATRPVLDVSVDTSWKETATTLEEIEAVSDDAPVVSDAEQELVDAFTEQQRDHQLDLVHVGRTLGYKLWKDDAFDLDERKAIVAEVQEELFHLKNSVECHRPDQDWDAIRRRIDLTKSRLEKTIAQIDQSGSNRAAAYLRNWESSILTFATAAVDGEVVPWTSNPVERSMGEIAKRCKNQWMSWTASGLEAILNLRLIRCLNPDTYESFVEELLHRSTKTNLNCDVSVAGTRG